MTVDQLARDLLSVVIFSHERPSQLAVAVESVLDACEDIDIIIVDDGSRSPEAVEGLQRFWQHGRVAVYQRHNFLKRWNPRGGFYPNIRFALRTVQTPFALLMEDDQQVIRRLQDEEFAAIVACMSQLRSPFMGVTFAHKKLAYLLSSEATHGGLFVKSAQAAFSTNAIVSMARLREHRFRIGPSAQATNAAAASYFGPHPVWPTPLLAYRVSSHGFRFGRPIGESQTSEEADESRYGLLDSPAVVHLKSKFPDVPTVAEYLSTHGSVELPTSFVLPNSRGRKSVFQRLWYFLTTRAYLLAMTIGHLKRRKASSDLVILAPVKLDHTSRTDVA